MPDENKPITKAPEPVQPGTNPGSEPVSPPAAEKPGTRDVPASGEETKPEASAARIRPEKTGAAEENPLLSQREQEHLTYLRVLRKYNDAKVKRIHYRRYGTLFILISALVFLALIFSLSTKILFLCLWIVTVLYCVFLMIRADYRYHCYKEMLGIADENDEYEKEALIAEAEEESEADPGKNGGKQ